MEDSASKDQRPTPSGQASVARRRELVEEIGPYDVMLGRGAPISENEGNARLRQIVVRRHADYVAAMDRNAKHRVAIEIVDTVLQKGGRFLQKATDVETYNMDGAWEVVLDAPNEVIMRKVKQLLRDMGPEARERRAERKRLARKKHGENKTKAAEASEPNTHPSRSTKHAQPLESSALPAEESKMVSSAVHAAAAHLSNAQIQAGPGTGPFSLPPIASAVSVSQGTTVNNLTDHPLLSIIGTAQQSSALRPSERAALLSLLVSTALSSQQQQRHGPLDDHGLLGNMAHLIRQQQRQQQSAQQQQYLTAFLQQQAATRQLNNTRTVLSPPQLQQQLLRQHTGIDAQILRLLLQQNHVNPQRLQLMSLLTAPTTASPSSIVNPAVALLAHSSSSSTPHTEETSQQLTLERAVHAHLASWGDSSPSLHFQQQPVQVASERPSEQRQERQPKGEKKHVGDNQGGDESSLSS